MAAQAVAHVFEVERSATHPVVSATKSLFVKCRPCSQSGGYFANPKAQEDISPQSLVVSVLPALDDPVSLSTSPSPFGRVLT